MQSVDFVKKSHRRYRQNERNNIVNASAIDAIASRIEELKHSPSMEGCGKDTIMIIIIIIAVIVSSLIFDFLVWPGLFDSPLLEVNYWND